MNVITRGMRGALRSPLRSGAIVAMLAISIGLILAMLVARSSVEAKIDEIKATTATSITVRAAGMMGGLGGGDLLTADHMATINNTAHIKSIVASLTEQIRSEDSSLIPSSEAKMRTPMNAQEMQAPQAPKDIPKPPIIFSGTSDPTTVIPADKLTSGAMIDGNSDALDVLIGKTLAEKNSLNVGDTFTAYDKTVTVKGIYFTDDMFQDNNIVMAIPALQILTEQPGAATTVNIKVDSSDNVAAVTTALKNALGNKATITSDQDTAEASLSPLKSISGLALGGVIGAAIAGAGIILLSMIMVVRERRREIGVIKAIGGTNVKVVTQFITEAVTLTIVGGIIGLGLGVAVSGPMTQMLVDNSQTASEQLPPQGKGGAGPQRRPGGPKSINEQLTANIDSVTSTLTPQTFVGGIGIVLLIAIVGSAIPALAIARVRPAEVLRTE